MKRLSLALLFLVIAVWPVWAQQPAQVIGPITPGDLPVFNSPTIIKDSGIPSSSGPFGTYQSGQVCGNSTSSPTIGCSPSGFSALFDKACSSTIGQAWVRLTGGWGCTSLGYANPVWWGAVGDGTTDNSPFVKSARQALDAAGGGVILFPAGNFCLKTADANNAAIAINAKPITVVGVGINVSFLETCGSDISIGYANIVGAGFLNFSYLGKGGQGNPGDTTFGATAPAFKFDTACGICRIDYVRGFGGLYGLDNLGFDSWVSNFSFGYSYGNAIMHEAGNGHRVEHGALDQNWPVVLPNQNSLTISAWQSTHSYTGNGASNTNVVSTQGYNIQLVSASCTSGGSAPTLQNYGTAITDGTCSWQLVGNTTYYGDDCDGNCAELILHGEVDLNCGGCFANFAMTNNNAGTAPSVVEIDGSSIGQSIQSGILLRAGAGFSMTNTHVATSVSTNALGIDVDNSGTFSGDASIVGNRFSGTGACIAIGTPPSGQAGYTITANRFLSCGNAIDYFNTGAALHITAGHNTMVGVTTAFTVPSGSSFYEFTNNDVNGAAVTFTAGDSNQIVAGNDGGGIPASALPNPTSSTLGGVKSIAAITHQFLTSIGTTGTPTQAQPACGDLSDSGNYCKLSAGQLTNSLSGDVTMNNSANYFPGPTVAQGTVGTWFASGTVTFTDTVSAVTFYCKLWDGTTVIASGGTTIIAGAFMSMSLSGVLTSPAANIRMDCRDSGANTGVMKFNQSGNAKDSTLTAFRIN